MNIVYFNTHDSGRYLSPYGYNVPSKQINAFARDAVLFRNAFCASPTCSPSRGALLSGMYPHNNGLIGLSHRGFEMNDYKQHLGSFLKDNGYQTAVAGTEHIANHGFFKQHEMNYDVLPYDTIIGPPGEDNDIENARDVAAYIKTFDKKNGPFFISFGLWSTHRKYPDAITEDYEPEYIKVPSTMKDTPENREDFAKYCTSVKIADDCFKIVLDALKEKGIYNDTLVLFTTDHGLASPFMKASLTDKGMGVATIMRIPGLNPSNRVIDGMVSQIDLFPTICDILSVDKPDYLQGISQLPVIEGAVSSVREKVFAETNYHASFEPMRCIRTDKFKYVRVYHDYGKPMLANIDDSMPKKGLVDEGFTDFEIYQEYLFDLTIDPNERINFINDTKYQDIASQLSSELLQHMKDTNDFLLDEHFTHPTGIVLNAPEAINPKDNPQIL